MKFRKNKIFYQTSCLKSISEKDRKIADLLNFLIYFLLNKNSCLKNPFSENLKILFVFFQLENINKKIYDTDDILKMRKNAKLVKLSGDREFLKILNKSKYF